MASKPERDQAPIDLSENDGASESGRRLYAKMPPLSDRCGGSHDDSLFIEVPEGMVLPEGVTVIIDESDDEESAE